VQVVDAMLRNDATTYSGQYYELWEAPMRPRPIQRPRPPLVLGAHRSRMLRIVAEFADDWNSFGTVDEMRERNAILDEHCSAIGRDPSTIVRSLYGWAAMMPSDPWASLDAFEDMVRRYSEAGVNEFLIDQPGDDQLPMLERVATELIPRLRGTTGSPALRA
jgi:alkanesulfonate monooxygenase SsuD/methylene tetrahydromethanopterin reductase-like flavin-dependent oxidoreductase (luciferase family)